jgi:GTP-binding protein
VRHRGPAPLARHRTRPPEERSLTAAEPHFLGSFPRADVTLAPPLAEIALVGRSNVGKSSLLNAFAGRQIARVSATPGKTQALNVYRLGSGTRPAGGARQAAPMGAAPYYVLDLPGYGYAKAAKTERARFRRLIADTLERPLLAGVVWLLDIRRAPSADDQAMQALLAARATRVLAALTKSDTLAASARRARARALQGALALDSDQVIVTSARVAEGIAELREAIHGLVAAP